LLEVQSMVLVLLVRVVLLLLLLLLWVLVLNIVPEMVPVLVREQDLVLVLNHFLLKEICLQNSNLALGLGLVWVVSVMVPRMVLGLGLVWVVSVMVPRMVPEVLGNALPRATTVQVGSHFQALRNQNGLASFQVALPPLMPETFVCFSRVPWIFFPGRFFFPGCTPPPLLGTLVLCLRCRRFFFPGCTPPPLLGTLVLCLRCRRF
jgi:hypothetical protein